VILLEIGALKGRYDDSDPEAAQWLQKIEQLVLKQGEIIFEARRNLREMANLGSRVEELRAEYNGKSGQKTATEK